jgi:toxin FitB
LENCAVAQIIYILDTNVLSLAGLREPPEGLVAWIKNVGVGQLALCHPVICELLRGAHMSAVSNPGKSERLFAWVDSVMRAGFIQIDMNWDVTRAYAKLLSERRLKSLWAADIRRSNDKVGHDLMIAAHAIAYGMPIASNNVRDFISIHECHALPGLFDPLTDEWHVRPSVDDQGAWPTGAGEPPRAISVI